MDGASPPDPEEVPDSDDEDTLDPTADPTAASGYAAAVEGGSGGGRSSVAPQLVARPNPPAVAHAASGRALAAGPTPAAAVGAAARAGNENASTPAGTDRESAARPGGTVAAAASGADASNSDAHAEPHIEQAGPLLDQEVRNSPSGEAESKEDGEDAELL